MTPNDVSANVMKTILKWKGMIAVPSPFLHLTFIYNPFHINNYINMSNKKQSAVTPELEKAGHRDLSVSPTQYMPTQEDFDSFISPLLTQHPTTSTSSTFHEYPLTQYTPSDSNDERKEAIRSKRLQKRPSRRTRRTQRQTAQLKKSPKGMQRSKDF